MYKSYLRLSFKKFIKCTVHANFLLIYVIFLRHMEGLITIAKLFCVIISFLYSNNS